MVAINTVTFSSDAFDGLVAGHCGPTVRTADFFDAAARIVLASQHIVTDITVAYADGEAMNLHVESVR